MITFGVYGRQRGQLIRRVRSESYAKSLARKYRPAFVLRETWQQEAFKAEPTLAATVQVYSNTYQEV